MLYIFVILDPYKMTEQIEREFGVKRLALNPDAHTQHGISGLAFYVNLKMYRKYLP